MSRRRALVTGGSRGLGHAIARRLTIEGMDVLCPSRQELDLSKPESVREFTHNWRDPIDVLVNNAGINILNRIEDVREEDIDEMWMVNLRSIILLCQRASQDFGKSGRHGAIVNVSSVLGTISRPGRVVYSTMKAGLDGLTRSLAVELGQKGVLVNAVGPGYIDTELTRQNNDPATLERLASGIPLRRLGTPEEIAEIVCFLASERNTYISGQTILIDGGLAVS